MPIPPGISRSQSILATDGPTNCTASLTNEFTVFLLSDDEDDLSGRGGFIFMSLKIDEDGLPLVEMTFTSLCRLSFLQLLLLTATTSLFLNDGIPKLPPVRIDDDTSAFLDCLATFFA